MRPTILVFQRPFVSGFTREYRTLYGREIDFLFISDFKYRDDVGLIRRQYAYLKHPGTLSRDHDLDYPVIIRRCRYLSAIEPVLSRRLIDSAWLAIRDIFAELRVSALIGLPLDNYYQDLLNTYCTRNGIYTVNPLVSFLPDLMRITTRGEWIRVREPGAEEVEAYWRLLLERTFRPPWLSKHRKRRHLVKLWAKERAKKVFFETMKLVKADPYSFHYNTIYPLIPSLASFDVVKVSDLFEKDWTRLRERIRKHRKVVFFPLQFTPEVSLNYLIPDSRFGLYEQVLDAVLGSLPDDVFLIVKEHPDRYGYRPEGFYDRFLHRPNVALVHVAFSVQEVFDHCPFVVVTGGASTGAEAVVKGKTVISLGGAYYGGPEIREIKDFDEVRDWPSRLVPIENDERASRRFVERIVSNCLPVAYDFVRVGRDKAERSRRCISALMPYVLGQIEARQAAGSEAAAVDRRRVG